MVEDAAAAERLKRLDRIAELIAALILSAAALVSSYAGFQAELWDGEQAANYALAEQSRTQATGAATVAGEIIMLDHLLFTQWLNAYANGDARLQAFYRDRFRADFSTAFEAWIALRPQTNQAAPKTPFLMTSYISQAKEDAEAMRHRADGYFRKGERANNVSDAYVQTTVVLALGLFLAGIIQAFKNPGLRMGILSIAALACLVGAGRILWLPALRLI